MVVRHAFRNAMIPLVTIVAFDISAIIGGAVITESVFEWEGMGRLFIDGLREIDPNRVMAFFVVTGVAAVVFNLLADITYAVLDPRIRLGQVTRRDTMTLQDHDAAGRQIEADLLETISVVDETSIEQAEVAGLSQGQIVRRRFVRHKGAMIALGVPDPHRRPRRHEHRLGADPRLVEVQLHRPRPVGARRRRTDRRCRCARRGSAARASSSASTRSGSTTSWARTCSR